MIFTVAAFLFALNAHANPDFTGIWDGQCTTAQGSKSERLILIMDDEHSIQLNSAMFQLPTVKKETTQYSCGDPMDGRDTWCDEEQVYNYSWNATGTEINLDHDWSAPNARPENVNYSHMHIRLVGTALEVVTQSKEYDHGATEICTYPKRR